jgi:C1A family cysteine protease
VLLLVLLTRRRERTVERRGLGWIRDFRDGRDFVAPSVPELTLAPAVDLRKTPWMPPIVDQGQTSSCVGNASASVVRFMRRKLGLPDFQPSRLFIYYFARRLQNWQDADDGCMPRDAMKVLVSDGVCSEDDWVFDEAHVNDRPEQVDLHAALSHRTTKYVRMLVDDNLYHLKNSLNLGLPFTIGIPCFTSFFDVGADGRVPMPSGKDTLEGGHLMYVVGYSEVDQLFITPNSWSVDDGDHGVRYLSYEYVRTFGDDLWRIETTT